MRGLFYILGMIALWVGFSCNIDESTLSHQTLKSNFGIDEIDTFYLTDVRNISASEDGWIISDYFEHKFFDMNGDSYDANFYFGSKGKGPGELMEAGRFCTAGDTLLIMNSGAGSLEMYVKDRFVQGIKKEAFHFYGITRFDYKNGIFYLPAHDRIHRIMSYDILNDTIQYIGESEFQKNIDQFNHVFYSEGKIFAVSVTEPRILIYHFTGELLVDYRFREVDFVKKFMEFHSIYPNPPDGNSFQSLIQDAVFSEGDLFVLTASVGENDENQLRHIIRFEINNSFDDIYVKDVYELEDGYYTCFAVRGNELLAYDAHGMHKTLKMFTISNLED